MFRAFKAYQANVERKECQASADLKVQSVRLVSPASLVSQAFVVLKEHPAPRVK